MAEQNVEVGQVYVDKDRHHLIRVLFLVLPAVHGVREPSAVCYSRGKATCIGFRRLLTPSRYELVPQQETITMGASSSNEFPTCTKLLGSINP